MDGNRYENGQTKVQRLQWRGADKEGKGGQGKKRADKVVYLRVAEKDIAGRTM